MQDIWVRTQDLNIVLVKGFFAVLLLEDIGLTGIFADPDKRVLLGVYSRDRAAETMALIWDGIFHAVKNGTPIPLVEMPEE